ncbi:ABC transporter substrate-binding protein [Paenibacillus marinisediminis]
MRNKRKSFISLFLILVLLVVMTACGGKDSNSKETKSGQSGDKVTVEFWTISLQPTFNDYFNELIADFESKNQNIKIDWKDFPFDAIVNKLLTSIASDSAPGVVNLNTEFANQMGYRGALVDFNTVLSDEEKAEFFPGIYNSTMIKDKAYALPWYTGTSVMFMNKGLIEKAGLDANNPPKTKEELNEWSRQIKEKTGAYGYVVGLGMNSIIEEGISILNEDKTKAAFNTPETIKHIEDNLAIIDEGIAPKDKINYDKLLQMMASEEIAILTSAPSSLNQLKTSAPDVYKQLVAAPIPVGKGNTRTSATMNLTVPSSYPHQEEAIAFARFVTNAENQLKFSKVANTLPSTIKSAEDPFFSENDGSLEGTAKTISVQSLDKASDVMFGIEQSSEIAEIINLHIENIVLNGGDIKSELDAAEKKINDLLK